MQNLLKENCDVNYQDEEKRSPLHAAAFKGDAKVVELLLQKGARVNTKDSKWLTPLHRACKTGNEVHLFVVPKSPLFVFLLTHCILPGNCECVIKL